MRRKPERRLVTARRSDNEKRQLITIVPPLADRRALADRAVFGGYSKHKLHPRAFGLQPLWAVSEDTVYCDGHAGFTPADMIRTRSLLRRGILSGLIGDKEAQGDPRILWAVDDNGWIYEARITVPGQTIYHGYPLLPGDAMATKVLSRFSRWVLGNEVEIVANDPNALDALKAAQERY